MIKELMYEATLKNLAANALKSFGSYYNEGFQVNMCLLDYRQLFTMDQAKIGLIQNRINRALARTSFPSIQDEAKPSAQALINKSSKGRARNQISSPSSSDDCDSGSSPTVSCPLEGKHTATDDAENSE